MVALETYLKAIEFELHEMRKEGVNHNICMRNIQFCVNRIRKSMGKNADNTVINSLKELEDIGYQFVCEGDGKMCQHWFDKGKTLIIKKGQEFEDINELVLDEGYVQTHICSIRKI